MDRFDKFCLTIYLLYIFYWCCGENNAHLSWMYIYASVKIYGVLSRRAMSWLPDTCVSWLPDTASCSHRHSTPDY